MDTVTLKNEALQRIEKAEKTSDLEQLRIEYLAKKGTVQQLMVQMKDLSPEEKPAFGQKVNELKKVITQALEDRQKQLAESELNERLKTEKIDISLDASSAPVGSLHPLTLITQQIEDIFVGLGYEVAEGPEVELDLYNFEKANIPADHPSRDMQDTFISIPTRC